MRLIILLSVIISALLLSCKASQSLTAPVVANTDSSAVPLVGHKWYLVKIHSAPAELNPLEKKAFIKFNTEKGSAGGNGSCNTFGSTLTVAGDKLTVKDLFSTKMFCEGVQGTEDAFFKQLGKVTRFEIVGTKLFLYAHSEILLELKSESI